MSKKLKANWKAGSIRAIFDAENMAEAERILKQVVARYEKEMPQLAKWMQENISEGLTIFNFPSDHRRRLRTSNIAERVNQEIRRRSCVARIFPNALSCERLTGAIVMEISEQWLSSVTYLNVV